MYVEMCRLYAWRSYVKSLVCPSNRAAQLYEYTNVEIIFTSLWVMVFLSQQTLAVSITIATSLAYFSLSLPPSTPRTPSPCLFLSFSVHWGHCKTLAWVPSPQEAQGLRADWSLDFTTGSKNGDCSRSFSFPLRPLWIKDSWLLVQ